MLKPNKVISYFSIIINDIEKGESRNFVLYPSNLDRITFRAVEVVEIFGFDNVQSGIAQSLQKRNQLVFVNRVSFARFADETATGQP
jgi:hypothetical protein